MSEALAAVAGDTVAIASDHAGVDLKAVLAGDLAQLGFKVLDLGTQGTGSVDYPDFGTAVARAIADHRATAGVVICGTGIGISIAANRVPGVRAALVHDQFTAAMAREHNDANVLALGARVLSVDAARHALKVFFATPFSGGRHVQRVAKLG
ncbi:MAG: ribose 5-phosphate isomerase B [Rhodospirillaceae bacterium]|nr:ribose 5-phosphate isomerase B [Rhodospirillaceae bacterium]